MSRIRTFRVASSTPLIVLGVLVGMAVADFQTPHTFVNGTVADANQVNANFAAVSGALDALGMRLDALEASAAVGPATPVRIVYGEVDAAGAAVAGAGFTPIQFAPLGFTGIASGPWDAPPTTIVQVLGDTPYDIFVIENGTGANISITDPATGAPVFVPFRFVQFGAPQ